MLPLMLRTRLVTGAVLIAALGLLVWGDSAVEGIPSAGAGAPPGWLLMTVSVLGLAPLLAIELARLLRATGLAADTVVLVLSAMCGTLCAAWLVPGALEGDAPFAQCLMVLALIPLALLVVAAITHCTRATTAVGGPNARAQTAAGAIGAALLAYAWIGLGLGSWVALRRDTSAWALGGAILTVKSADIGAYFTGMAIGRHKLIPWLSPGKTWEGLIGGCVASAAVGFLLVGGCCPTPSACAASTGLQGPTAALLGAGFGLVGTAGDLLESLLKRGASAKDSGTFLPGMGGFLDVFDSLLTTGPLAWIAISLLRT